MMISIGMQEKINAFIDEQKAKPTENRTLENHMIEWILEYLMSEECHVTASKTDHENRKMWIEFTFGNDE